MSSLLAWLQCHVSVLPEPLQDDTSWHFSFWCPCVLGGAFSDAHFASETFGAISPSSWRFVYGPTCTIEADAEKIAGTNRHWRGQFPYRGSRHKSAVVQLARPHFKAMETPDRIAPTMMSAMFSAFMQQGVIMALAVMILDGGAVAQSCFYAFAAFWAGVAVILWRRAATPTKADLVLVRGGFIVLCVLSYFLIHGIWHLRGY
ncbi:MAG: hypothetical protein WCS99_21430 [Limisphaerales bacterium]